MLNWLARYAPAVAALERDGELGSVLDVGCGRHGLACVRPDLPFVGLEIAFTGRPAPTMVPFTAEPGPLPFGDASFDTVISLDALEHIPPADRHGFVAELGRVTAGRMLLACPSDEAQRLDDLLRRDYAARGASEPSWLGEHDQHGLPSVSSITAVMESIEGFTATRVPMVNDLLNTLVVVADMYPDFAARAAAEMRERAAEWSALLTSATFGPSFREGWLLTRVAPRPALVRTSGLRESALAALTGEAQLLDAAGVPTPVGPVSEPAAGGALWLSADWGRPETWLPALSAYLHAAPANGTVALCFDAVDAGVELVAELVGHACERLAGEIPFGDVLIVDTPESADGAVRVHDAAGVRAALSAAEPVKTFAPEVIVESAIFAKGLADELRALADLRRFEAAPDPFEEAEPLVSVRIPTWNGVEGLVGRAIPSILGGSYRNVEVLVCSDGPDPVARAAVEAIEDARVRYLELPERPEYPEDKLSFWFTTGLRPANHALDHARGAFIAPLDHDDAFTVDHIERLVATAQRERADLVHGQALCERGGEPPIVIGAPTLARGAVVHGAVLYSSRLAGMRYDPHCWMLHQPGDWNLWERMLATGATTVYEPAVVVHHGRERTSIEPNPGPRIPPRPTTDELAADILATDARVLLDVAPLQAWLPIS